MVEPGDTCPSSETKSLAGISEGDDADGIFDQHEVDQEQLSGIVGWFGEGCEFVVCRSADDVVQCGELGEC